jgi:hypothetical protein
MWDPGCDYCITIEPTVHAEPLFTEAVFGVHCRFGRSGGVHIPLLVLSFFNKWKGKTPLRSSFCRLQQKLRIPVAYMPVVIVMLDSFINYGN